MKLKVCMRCGCELSFKEAFCASGGDLCAICERDKLERDNRAKRDQGNEDEQLGHVFRVNKDLCR